jgi:lytic murein transglycosylase
MRVLTAPLAALLAGAALGSAQAAASCGEDFGVWKAAVADEAKAAGVGPTGLAALAGAKIDPAVLERDRAQTVFTQTFAEFSSRMINKYRLRQGAEKLKQYADVFEQAEQEFGVPGPVVAAFWALETDFGAVQGDFDTLDALVTLSHDCRRPDLFKPQIVPLLTLIDRGSLPPDTKGAWAGEIGQTQILPTDYLERGVDGDGDGIVDLRKSAPDVIMTTANKLKSRGWKAGQPWLAEVRIPDTLPWEKTGRTIKLPISQWSAWGVTQRDGSPLPDNGLSAGLVLPMGHNGPAFLGYDNYDVYFEWNQSFVYTLTAAHLAARLAGAPPFDRRNPDEGLAAETMKQLQQKLAGMGYDVGEIDGVLGTGTREAVRKEQARLGLPVDGWPTPALLANL